MELWRTADFTTTLELVLPPQMKFGQCAMADDFWAVFALVLDTKAAFALADDILAAFTLANKIGAGFAIADEIWALRHHRTFGW